MLAFGTIKVLPPLNVITDIGDVSIRLEKLSVPGALRDEVTVPVVVAVAVIELAVVERAPVVAAVLPDTEGTEIPGPGIKVMKPWVATLV